MKKNYVFEVSRLLEASFHIFSWSGQEAICVLQLPCVAFFHPSLNWREKNFCLAFFQTLLSHWSIKIWLISPPYLRGLLNTFPKWYDTWNSDENCAFYGQKTEELRFCQKFWKNFRGLFGALKLEIFLKKRYFGVTLDRHYLILRSKSKSKKLTAHLLFFGPLLKPRLNY